MKERDYESIKTSTTLKLERGLSKDLYFHSAKFSENIINAIQELIPTQGITKEESYLLKLGGLLKNIGMTKTYFGYEKTSAEIAGKILNDFGCSNSEIQTIQKYILLKTNQGPYDRFDKIMLDSYHFHLGGEDFVARNEFLRLELQNQLKIAQKINPQIKHTKIPLRLWNERTLNFLKKHKYYTDGAKKLKQNGKEENIKDIEKLLQNEELKNINLKINHVIGALRKKKYPQAQIISSLVKIVNPKK